MTGLVASLVALEGADRLPLRLSALVYPRAAIEAAAERLAVECTLREDGGQLLLSVADPARLDPLLEAALLGQPA